MQCRFDLDLTAELLVLVGAYARRRSIAIPDALVELVRGGLAMDAALLASAEEGLFSDGDVTWVPSEGGDL